MGCYVMVTNWLFLGYTGKFSMEKASRSTEKVSSKMLKNWNLQTANLRLEFYFFPDVSCS